MAGEIWPCPSCERVFLEEDSLRTHSSQIHGEVLHRGDADPEEIWPDDEQSASPRIQKYSLRGQASSD